LPDIVVAKIGQDKTPIPPARPAKGEDPERIAQGNGSRVNAFTR
jgi:hypothetical protein